MILEIPKDKIVQLVWEEAARQLKLPVKGCDVTITFIIKKHTLVNAKVEAELKK